MLKDLMHLPVISFVLRLSSFLRGSEVSIGGRLLVGQRLREFQLTGGGAVSNRSNRLFGGPFYLVYLLGRLVFDQTNGVSVIISSALRGNKCLLSEAKALLH